MSLTPQDELHLTRALTLAREAAAFASPNPTVGCVLTLNNLTLGEGAHHYDARDHAEIAALKQAAALGHNVRGATAYVTLEPCAHHGRTGPCSDALIAAGIARCVVATVDPNPLVSGQGLAKLRAANVEVVLLDPTHPSPSKPAASTTPSPSPSSTIAPSSPSRPRSRSTANSPHHPPPAPPPRPTGSPAPPPAPTPNSSATPPTPSSPASAPSSPTTPPSPTAPTSPVAAPSSASSSTAPSALPSTHSSSQLTPSSLTGAHLRQWRDPCIPDRQPHLNSDS